MSTSSVPLHDAARSGESRVSPPNPKWRRVVGAALALAILAGLAALAWEWRHPDVFREADGSIGMNAESWPVGKAIYVGVTFGDESSDPISLESVEPAVERNSAQAEIGYYVCTAKQPGGGNIGSAGPGAVKQHCGALDLIDRSFKFQPGEGRQILMQVIPTTAGVVQVSSSKITYRSGWQSGSQRVGDGIRVNALPE